MADPFLLAQQNQQRLDSSTRALERIPEFVLEGLRVPGILAQNRILSAQAKEAEGSLTVSEQLKKTVQDPHGIMAEFGDLKTAKDMRIFMAKHAAIAVSPIGKNLLGVFDRITTATESAELSSIERIGQLAEAKAAAEFNFRMGQEGLDRNNPEDVILMRKRDAINDLAEAAQKSNRVFDPALLPFDVFTDNGRIDPIKKWQAINAMPRLSAVIPVIPSIPGMEPSRVTVGPKGASVTMELKDTDGTRTGVLPEIERIFQQAEKEGTPFTPKAKEMARSVRLGLEGREGVEKKPISEAEYVAKNLRDFLETKPTKEVPGKVFGKNKEPLTEDEAIDALRRQYRTIFGEASVPPPPASNMIRVRSKKNPSRTGWATQSDIDSDSNLEPLPPGKG